MTIIAERLFEVFPYMVLSREIMIQMEEFLNQEYPEASWTVESKSWGSITLNPTFKNDAERTFYMLKWS